MSVRFEPTAEDLARWRALGVAARRAAMAPAKPADALARAVKRANSAIVPGGTAPDSPFLALFRRAREWEALSGPARAERGPELGRLAAACAEALRDPGPGAAEAPPAPGALTRRILGEADG